MCTSEWYCKTMYGSPRIVNYYEKSLLAVVKKANDEDGRLTTLLKKVGNEKAITSYIPIKTSNNTSLGLITKSIKNINENL